MKTVPKEKKRKEGTLKDEPKTADLNDSEEIKTDFPLSEKDEVKQAETRMRNAAKKRNN